jgi:uncharacterized protein YbdZ (MbtH family)
MTHMSWSLRGRRLWGVGLVAAALAVAPVTTAAGASTASAGIADGTWSCSRPPAGYTYDALQQSFGCDALYPVIMYHIRVPKDGLQACSVPQGWTHSNYSFGWNSCGLNGGSASRYTLRIPRDGLSACSVPQGWAYDHLSSEWGICTNNTSGLVYHLRAPVAGLWSCNVPSGWAYSGTSTVLAECTVSGFGRKYRLA